MVVRTAERGADWSKTAASSVIPVKARSVMATFDAQAVAQLLREFAGRSSLRGGNPYRAKAYARAADSLAALVVPLAQIVDAGRLTEIPGIGDAIADIVTKLHRTGTHPSLEAMRKEIPAGVLEMLAVPGLRPDKVLKLYKTLGITSLADLEQAAREDRIKRAKGLGGALQAKIIRSLEIARSGEGRLHMHRAAILLENAERSLQQAHPELKRITIAGDLRRGCELVADLALVAQAPALEDGPTTLASGGGLKVYLTDKWHYGITLLLATGSPQHIEGLHALATHKGLKLAPEGLRRGRKVLAARSEEDIYAALGLPFIEPELREGRGEIERASKEKLPALVTEREVRAYDKGARFGGLPADRCILVLQVLPPRSERPPLVPRFRPEIAGKQRAGRGQDEQGTEKTEQAVNEPGVPTLCHGILQEAMMAGLHHRKSFQQEEGPRIALMVYDGGAARKEKMP